MASGLPDHYRGVDVAYQALAQMIVRPKYGGALLESGSEAVGANTSVLLALGLGKGMIYGGNVWLDAAASQANSEVQLTIDGVIITTLSFLRLNEYRIVNPRTSVVTLNRYDPVSHIYSVGISYGVTFETYVMLVYKETHGNTPTAHYRLVYSLI